MFFRLVFLVCILSATFALQMQRKVVSTTPSSLFSTESNNANADLFAKSNPVEGTSNSNPLTIDDHEEIVVDFDALSAESAFQAFKPKTDLSSMYVQGERKAPRQAKWLPLLLSPKVLDGTLAGDVGFDPIGFSKDKQALWKYREAEIKHSRLAMLAAAGWPLSELWHKDIANFLGLDSILTEAGKAPSVLNGGLANFWIIGAGVVSILVGAILEFKTFEKAKQENYKPGELDFDPLRFHTFRSTFNLDPITEKITREEKLNRAKLDTELCEIKHGRLGMLAITAYALQEFISGIPVVQQTPFFFGDPIF